MVRTKVMALNSTKESSGKPDQETAGQRRDGEGRARSQAEELTRKDRFTR
jgi:hypothetical protein